MATSSILHNVVIEDPETVRKFCEGLVKAERIAKYNVAKNKHGNNSAIKVNLPPSLELKKIGFREYDDKWHYYKIISNYSETSFNVTISKRDTNDFYIYVLDEDFGQYYDYQAKLLEDGSNKLAAKVKEAVETQMEYLTEVGVLSGHARGEYI